MKPIVIVLTGNAASGKSTLAIKLSERLQGLAVLKFDDYFETMQGWPNNLNGWINDGADVSEWRNPKFAQDIKRLLVGKRIEHPISKRLIEPSSIILLEDPTGRGRKEIADLIDYSFFLDIPNDISLIRILKRWLDLETITKSGLNAKMKEENPTELLEQIIIFLKKYLNSYRNMYIVVCERTKRDADLILDGMKPSEALVTEVVNFLKERKISLPGEELD